MNKLILQPTIIYLINFLLWCCFKMFVTNIFKRQQNKKLKRLMIVGWDISYSHFAEVNLYILAGFLLKFARHFSIGWTQESRLWSSSLPCRSCNNLAHWGHAKMATIFQTSFSNAFYWMKMYEFWLKFHLKLFLRVQLAMFQHWFR